MADEQKVEDMAQEDQIIAPEPEYPKREAKIAGKAVIFQRHLPAKLFLRTVGVFIKGNILETASLKEIFEAVHPLIESWELEGDPHNFATWEELDAFEQLAPLTFAAIAYTNRKYDYAAARAKN